MIEQTQKVLVGGIQKFSTEDGPGIRTTVFLKGCPLECKWCHNPELIAYGQQVIEMPNSCIHCGYCVDNCPLSAVSLNDKNQIRVNRELCNGCLLCTEFCYSGGLQAVAKEMTADEVMKEVLQDKGFYDNTEGGMTVSGGEILSHPEFVEQLINIADENNVNVCLDTSGYGNREDLLRLAKSDNVTNILYDMKAIDDTVHIEYTGKSNKLILDNLKALAEDNETLDKIWMRMPLVKDVNDGEKIIKRTGEFYKKYGIKNVTILPYHNLGVSKMKNIGGEALSFKPSTEENLEEIKKYFENEVGMKVDILGQI